MALQDLIGCLAAAFVLATFSARTMVRLRRRAAGLGPLLLLRSRMLPL